MMYVCKLYLGEFWDHKSLQIRKQFLYMSLFLSHHSLFLSLFTSSIQAAHIQNFTRQILIQGYFN